MDANCNNQIMNERRIDNISTSSCVVYFAYRTSKPVICTLGFRDFITQKDPIARVAPVKSGEGHKFTSEGVLRAPFGFNPFINQKFRKIKIQYTPSSEAEFLQVQQEARIKVFFRGFPLGTKTEEIKRFFSDFGIVEYIYIMASSKQGRNQNFLQGYIVFSSNHEAEIFLAQKMLHFFRGIKICCQVYIGNKKKKMNSEYKQPNPPMYTGEFQGAISPTNKNPYHSWHQEMNYQSFGEFGVKSLDLKIPQVSYGGTNFGTAVELKGSNQRSQRPFLKNLDLVKTNSKENLNIRFNICRPQGLRPTQVNNRVLH